MRFVIILIGVLLLIFFGLPDKILYAKDGAEKWLPFIIIFFLIPFLLYKTLADFKIRKDICFAISIGSVLIIGPLFGIWTGKKSDAELNENGMIQKGIVIQKWYARKHKSSSGEWLYRAEFRIDNRIYYTFSHKDINNVIKIGDTILIKYSAKNPENNTIVNR